MVCSADRTEVAWENITELFVPPPITKWDFEYFNAQDTISETRVDLDGGIFCHEEIKCEGKMGVIPFGRGMNRGSI